MNYRHMQDEIYFYSTNHNSPKLLFGDALLKGLAPDRGLYMPEKIPTFTKQEIKSFSSKLYHEIAFEVINRFLHHQIPENKLLELTKDAYDFPIPIEKVYNNIHVMRLDRGPTASFKDFAARMMARLMNFFLEKQNKNIVILTATSGDTGSAVANAFYGLENIKVVVLYPENEITPRQRKQMTTLGKNIQILAIDGKFDDCQRIVKDAFSDSELNYLNLSSANSINIGRLIPQIVYYIYAYAKLNLDNEDIIFSIPSGNFGNMMGGIIAKNMGLPIKKFIIATNSNDAFPKFLKTGEYKKIEPSINCISSAMNVGHPSNLSRLITLFNGIMDEKGNIEKMPYLKGMQRDIFAISINDQTTKDTIKEAFEKYNILLEPHGAVGWKGLMTYLNQNKNLKDQLCVSIETAHPAKFPEQIEEILKINPKLPPSLKDLDNKKESIIKLKCSYDSFKNFLKNNL